MFKTCVTHPAAGRTLLELLLVQVILAILLLHASSAWRVPAAKRQAQRLQAFLAQARIHAALMHEPLSMCPWKEGACHSTWSAPEIVCLGPDGDPKASMPVSHAVAISYQGFPNSLSILWGEDGLSRSNGTFVVQDAQQSWQVVLNQQGLTRWVQQSTDKAAILEP